LLKNIKLFCGRSAFVFFEGLVVVAILLAIALGGVVWTLRAGPVDISFAKDYIQDALRDPERGAYATMDRVVLHWPDLGGPLLLGMQNAVVHKGDGTDLVAVDEVALALSKSHLLLGQIAPQALVLRHPTLKIVRTAEGNFDIGFASDANASDEEIGEGQIKSQDELMKRVMMYIARHGEDEDTSPLASLQSMEIEKAKVAVSDEVMGRTWTLPEVNVSLQSEEAGLKVNVNAVLVDGGEKPTDLELTGNVPWKTKELEVEGRIRRFYLQNLSEFFPELQGFSKHQVALNAGIKARFDPGFSLLSAQIALRSNRGLLDLPEYYDDPLAYKDLSVELAYDHSDKRLELLGAEVTAHDLTVGLTGQVEILPEKISGPIRLEIDSFNQSQIPALWPKPLEGDSSEEWIVKKIQAGEYQNGFMSMELEASKGEEGWGFDAKNILAGFDFQGLSMDYRAPLKPVRQAKGHASFDYAADQLTVDIEQGLIEDLAVTNGQVLLSDVVAVGKGGVDISLHLKGPLRDVFRYIKEEPIGQTQDFDIDLVKGEADLDVKTSFPLSEDVKVEDVAVEVSGQLTNAVIPKVVNDLDFSKGTLDLNVKDNKYMLKGKGALMGRPITLEYDGFLRSSGQKYSSKLSADFVMDKAMREAFGMNIDMFVEGSFPVYVVHKTYNKRPSTTDVQVDLTPGYLRVDPFDYEKKPGQKGSASLSAIVENGDILEVRDLTATAPNFQLGNTTLVFRKKGDESDLHLGQISRFHLGETVAKMEFEFEPSGRMKIVLDGPFLDLRPFLDQEEGRDPSQHEAPPMLISVAVDRMRTADGETVEYGKIYIDIDDQGRFNQFELDAVAGKGDVYLRFKPDEQGMRVFRFEADDAGATLKAFGIYDKIIGGTMVIYGEPIRSLYDRNLVGAAELRDFRVQKAPGLAKLFSALSFPGLLDALNDEGLAFTRLKSNFDWLYRPQGSLLVLKEGRTSGNELGLTFDGVFDNGEGTLDVSGTIVPLSTVNKVISNIPVIGTILSGGSDSIFAATYEAKGKAKDPEIFVNPLAVLAPGLLRRILFEQN